MLLVWMGDRIDASSESFMMGWVTGTRHELESILDETVYIVWVDR
jgi:hypothetical protein